jgi:hypothetical protein
MVRENVQIRFLMAIAIWSAGFGVAAAAPWKFETVDTGQARWHDAVQGDSHGDFYLVVQCFEPGRLSISVESPFDWDPSGNYDGTVPAAFVVDNQPLAELSFTYDARSLGEGVVAWADGQQGAYFTLLDALAAAREPIGFSYADRQTVFESEGSRAAIAQVREACS